MNNDANEIMIKALEKIANGEGTYGAQAFEYKQIAIEALMRAALSVFPPNARSSILKSAEEKVNGGREQEYGGPEHSFTMIAKMWTTYLEDRIEIRPEDVAYMMILLKLCRLARTPNHQDSIVDIAGYAACAGEIVGK